MARNYSNIAFDTTLVAGISAGDASMVVTSASGWPAVPFAAVLDPGSLTVEEVVQVTNVAGTTFTITRGFDGTTAAAHSAGATVRHSAIAGDFTDLQAMDTTNASAISGLAAALAGYAVLAASNLFTLRQDIRASGSAIAAALHAPWVTGDTLPAAVFGATTAGNNQNAVTALSNSGNALFANSVSAAGVAAQTSSGTGLFATAIANTGTPLSAILIGTNTNVVATVLKVGQRSSGTPAASFGVGIKAMLNSNTTADQDASQISTLWTDATHATRTAALTINTVSAGGALTEHLRASNNIVLVPVSFKATGGNLTFDGVGANITAPFGNVLSIDATSAATIQLSTSSNTAQNVITPVVTMRMRTFGTPANGIGAGLKMQINSSTSANQDAALIAAVATDITHATRTDALVVQTVANAGALTERARIDAGPGADTTGFLLWDVNSGATKRVEVGAADSGGVGFRMLRVAN